MIEITADNFEKEVLQNDGLILVDVGASWCPSCRGMVPIIEQLAEETKGKLKIVKLDAGVEEDLSDKIGITGLPTFLLYQNGELVDSIAGPTSKKSLLEMVEKAKK